MSERQRENPERPRPTVVFDDPEVGKDRAALQARDDAEAAARVALERRIPQMREIYPKLVAGTASAREVQGALAFVLRWMNVQERD